MFTKYSNWNNMLQTGWKDDLTTTTVMRSHQNVVWVVYLSKRESRCRMPSQFGAGGSLWREWHHGFQVCVHILRSLATIKEGDWYSVPSHFVCRHWNQALSWPLLDGGDKWHSCICRCLCEGNLFVSGWNTNIHKYMLVINSSKEHGQFWSCNCTLNLKSYYVYIALLVGE